MKNSLENLKQQITTPWTPVKVFEANNQVGYFALFKGKYKWHSHQDYDETFYIYEGKIIIQIKDGEDIDLEAGDMAVVPKGTEHCPKSDVDSYVLMIEPKTIQSEN